MESIEQKNITTQTKAKPNKNQLMRWVNDRLDMTEDGVNALEDK